MEQQQNHLNKALSRKKFLLVLDDVWNEDRGKWEALRDILRQEHARGSKVLVTSRSNTVADVMDASPSCILQGFFVEDSLSAFVKCAFKGEERKYHELVELGKEIALKCGGVPLA
jgi:DNA-binding NarL/FixJ family response regulator